MTWLATAGNCSFSHVTIGSAFPKYSTLKPNLKWIQCLVAEIYPSEDAELWTMRQDSMLAKIKA